MISIIVLSCVQQQSKPIEGAWNLVYAQNIAGDTLVREFPGDYTGTAIKIWSKGYVLYVGRLKMDTTYIDGYGGGPYKLNGNRYEENIQYFSNQSYVGMTVKMLLEIRNDTLIQTWPIDDNGQIDKSNYRQEKRVRLD
jgi:hypothetical protein